MMNKKIWKRICLAWLSITCLLVVVIALFYVIENVSGRKAWERYVKECETKNQTAASDQEKTYLWIEDIIPPAVDEEKNFANHPLFKEVFRRAKEGLPDINSDENKDLDESLEIWRLLLRSRGYYWYWLGEPDYTKVRRADLRRIQKYSKAHDYEDIPKEECISFLQEKLEPGLAGYENIRQALKEYPQCLYPVEYEKGFGAILPHLGVLKSISTVASLRALIKQALGQNDEALEDLFFIMDLGDTLSQGRMMIDVVYKGVIYEKALNVIWEGIESDFWTPEQLEQIQKRLKKWNIRTNLRMAMVAERTFINNALKQDPHGFFAKDPEITFMDNFPYECIKRLIPTGWSYRIWLACNKRIDQILSEFDAEDRYYNVDRSLLNFANELNVKGVPKWAMEYSAHLGVYGVDKILKAQFGIDAVRVACALERYRLENKKYPDSLEDLGELFPKEELPRDCIDGEVLRYRTTDTGYLLWSVGWDKKDNGGGRHLHQKQDDGASLYYEDWGWEITREKIGEEK